MFWRIAKLRKCHFKKGMCIQRFWMDHRLPSLRATEALSTYQLMKDASLKHFNLNLEKGISRQCIKDKSST